MRPVHRIPAEWNPKILFRNAEKGLIFDPTDPKTLYTDTGLTTRIVADGDAVAGVADQSKNAFNGTQGTAGARPAYNTTINPRGSIALDGGDWLDFGATAGSIFQNSSYGTLMVFARPSASGTNQVVFVSTANGSSGGRLGITIIGTTGTISVGTRRLDADTTQFAIGSVNLAATDHVLIAEADWANTLVYFAHDLTTPGSSVPTWGAGSATSDTASSFVRMGISGADSQPLTGEVGRILAINRKLTNDERVNAIKWCGRPYGLFT